MTREGHPVRGLALGVCVAVLGCAQNQQGLGGNPAAPSRAVTGSAAPFESPATAAAPRGPAEEVADVVREYVAVPPDPVDRPVVRSNDAVVADSGLRQRQSDAAPESTSAGGGLKHSPTGPPAATQPQPPVLGTVSIRPLREAPEPELAEPRSAANAALTAAPAVSQEGIQQEIQRLEEAVRRQPNDERSQLRLRFLYLAQGQHDLALSMPEGMDPRRAELLIKTVRSAVAGSQALQSPHLVSGETVAAVQDLNDFVRAQAGLHVPRVALCTEVHSYGNFTPIPGGYFVARRQRETVVYCEIENFATEMRNGNYTVRLAYRMALYTPDGKVVWRDQQDAPLTDVCRRRRTDFFFGRRWWLPAGTASGNYVLKVILEDKIKKEYAEAAFPLTVHPSEIAGH